MLSPRDRRRAKIARDAGLYVRDLLVVDGIEKPLITAGDYDAAFSPVDLRSHIRFGVPCREADAGAGLDLNTAEKILRGLDDVESAKSRHAATTARRS